MSTITATTPAFQWPADILDFAARNQVGSYLDPLLSAAHQLYPTACSVRVTLEHDRELRDVACIVFEVKVPKGDISNYALAKRAWGDELFRICPAPLVCNFCQILIPVSP